MVLVFFYVKRDVNLIAICRSSQAPLTCSLFFGDFLSEVLLESYLT